MGLFVLIWQVKQGIIQGKQGVFVFSRQLVGPSGMGMGLEQQQLWQVGQGLQVKQGQFIVRRSLAALGRRVG